jgi:hypothetical protein
VHLQQQQQQRMSRAVNVVVGYALTGY